VKVTSPNENEVIASYSNRTVPSVATAKNQCKVRVTLFDSAGTILGRDASDVYFEISR